MLTLAYPWLLLLLLLPLPLLYKRRSIRPVAAPAMPVGHWLADLPGVSKTGHRSPRWQQLMLLTAWGLLVVAIARPQQVGDAVDLPVSGRDLLLAVDLSPSMQERDMVWQGRSINRLHAVKAVVNDFISQREGDRLGLLLFATEAHMHVPLSFDHATLATLLDEAEIGMAGRATAIGDAIGLAVKHLRDRPQEQRVVILLTDGANTAGAVTPDKATEIAAATGVRLYTIGIGAETMIQRGLLGPRRVNPSADLDEPLLIRMAEQTGGRYFRARNLAELESIYASINQLEPIELEGQSYRPTDELYVWPVAGASLLWLLSLLLRSIGHVAWRRTRD
ncbi:vWA domain-containing protein [Marinobacter sp. X15-166B]|uniref:vWA domain-containing protein n=1 Tax=Marinobacter sp. X15-166B TaxID=1897620 RepID=UPI00085CA891|nr:VWA domain-containing protein [Marinobacter sp. X15-166B]OEY67103.1 BatB protein [Marinobacter sp. X15-166B]